MNDELYHFGIKGMKWGHRKARKHSDKKRAKNRAKNEEWLKKNVWYNSRFDKYNDSKFRDRKKKELTDVENVLNDLLVKGSSSKHYKSLGIEDYDDEPMSRKRKNELLQWSLADVYSGYSVNYTGYAEAKRYDKAIKSIDTSLPPKEYKEKVKQAKRNVGNDDLEPESLKRMGDIIRNEKYLDGFYDPKVTRPELSTNTLNDHELFKKNSVNHSAIMDNELYHFGIKGMKWGRRRFQNKSGGLTAEGRRRYSDETEGYRKSYEKYKEAASKSKGSEKYRNRLEANFAKQDYKDSKIYDRVKDKPKSQHRKNLEAKYRKKGMSEKEAVVAAHKRIRMEQAAAAVGAGVALNIAGNAARNHYYDTHDRVIKSGKKLQNVSTFKDRPLDRDIYSVRKQSDKSKYTGFFAKTHAPIALADNVYKHKMTVGKDLKVASNDSARKAFAEVVRDNPDQVAKSLIAFNNAEKQGPRTKKSIKTSLNAFNALKEGDYGNKDLYNMFNRSIVFNNNSGSGQLNQDFYNKLKSKGYGAIQDINDRKYSGYKTKDPLIMFDAKNNISKVDTKEIGELEQHYGFLKKLGIDSAPTLAALAAADYGYNKGMTRLAQSSMVKQYKKQHPGTKMSDKEILRMYQRESIR